MIAPVSPATNPPALALNGITRRFGRVTALDQATLVVRPGTVHALLGENGAGKTTLMRVAFGLVQPDAGTIELRGKAVRIPSPSAALAAGIGMVHQHFSLVPAMTVAENVALGGRGLFSTKQWTARVHEIGERTGLVLNPLARVSELSVGAQQRCEIVKALARDVELLILDEPTAVLAPAEAQELLQWVKRFAHAGHAVVLITHKLRDALAVASDVTVLRRGQTVLQAAMDTTNEGALAAAIVGDGGGVGSGGISTSSVTDKFSAVALRFNPGSSPTSAPPTTQRSNAADTLSGTAVLRATNISVRDALGVARLNRASLAVHRGEIVGIAGVEGAGQHELLRVLAGRVAPVEGEVQLPQKVGFVPEDRHHDALLLDRSLVENVALRNAGVRRGRMPWNELRENTRTLIAGNDVRTASEDVEARTLSGGNQQKLILARELADRPEALVVENPTRGLDFRAAQAVLEALRSAGAAGTAVVVYSSDLDEVLALAHRVVVMHGGHLVEVPRDRELIGRAMLGA